MSKDRRVFVGNVAFTLTNGPKSVTFTVQARMEVQRQIRGTTENPLETWQATASRKIIATAGFDTRDYENENSPMTFPCRLDMRADTEAWYKMLRDIVLQDKYLQGILRIIKRRLRAKQASFERGQ